MHEENCRWFFNRGSWEHQSLKCCENVYCIQKCFHFKKIQLEAQFIFGIFRKTPLHVSDVSTDHRSFSMTVCCSAVKQTVT